MEFMPIYFMKYLSIFIQQFPTFYHYIRNNSLNLNINTLSMALANYLILINLFTNLTNFSYFHVRKATKATYLTDAIIYQVIIRY